MATEKRLIDANALKDKFMYLRKMWSETEIVLTINDAKTVDAVEVIRCKDCASGKGATHKVCPLYKQGLMKDDDFCSAGERKNHD